MTHATLRNDPDHNGTSRLRALAALASPATSTPTAAAGSHTFSRSGTPLLQASPAAASPTTPTPSSPQPDRAVKLDADSIVCRM